MTNQTTEKVFIVAFIFTVIVFCLVVVGFFLLGVKFTLNFVPEVNIFGINMSR